MGVFVNKKKKFIIKDWASNFLQKDGTFNRSRYGAFKGIPKTFKSFEDGWDWISENIEDEEVHQDLYVEELEND